MKIDVSKIDGYAEMTAEAKLKALEEYDFPEDDAAKLKNALNKASSDVASYKKALREKETAEETAKRERQEAEDALKNEIESLRKEKAVSQKTADFLKLGFGADDAKATAEAFVSGNDEVVSTNLANLIATIKANAQAEALKSQPGLVGGNPPVKTAEEQQADEINRIVNLV